MIGTGRTWTAAGDELIAALYAAPGGPARLRAALPSKTAGAIRSRARRLGVAAPRPPGEEPPTLHCSWCPAWASGLDEGGDAECEACAARAAGRALTVDERWARLAPFAARLRLPTPDAAAAALDCTRAELLDRVTFLGARRGLRGRGRHGNERVIAWRGQRKTAREWEAETGVPAKVVIDRLAKGWGVERALTEPIAVARAAAAQAARAARAPRAAAEERVTPARAAAAARIKAWGRAAVVVGRLPTLGRSADIYAFGDDRRTLAQWAAHFGVTRQWLWRARKRAAEQAKGAKAA